MRVQHAQGGVEQGDLYGLALSGSFALKEGQQDAGCRVHARGGIHQWNADAHGIECRVPVDGHEPGEGLHGGVVTGQPTELTVFAKARDAAMHQPGILTRQRRGAVDAPFLPGAQLEILDEDIRLTEHPEENVAPLVRGEVQRNVFLVSVEPDVVGRVLLDERRSVAPGVISVKGFDLDDFCAVVAQNLGRKRSRKDPGNVQNDNALERRLAHGGQGVRVARIQSLLAPEAFTMGAQRLISAAMNAPKEAGVLGSSRTPIPFMRAWKAGLARTFCSA